MADNYTRLTKGSAVFSDMMKGFAITTVMNAKIYEISVDDIAGFADQTAEEIRDTYKKEKEPMAVIDTLKTANVTVEGPTKTITGGQYSNPLIKFGKTARLEMQDALGRADVIEAFGGAVNEYQYGTNSTTKDYKTIVAMHSTGDFAPARLIIGESFFIDRQTARQVKVDIIFYQVMPDSIFNLTQDAEGDATVFDMNADLLTTDIKLPITVKDDNGDDKDDTEAHGVFYSIIAYKSPEDIVITPKA